jgi:tRNA(adenine34) deaminase
MPRRSSDNQDMDGTAPEGERSGALCGAEDGYGLEDAAGMALALALAEEARDADEVPIGAVVVRAGALIGVGRNRCRRDADATAHAELLALRDAFRRTGDMRLPGATVYSTVEPCFMCAGALAHARVTRVVWSVRDPKFGGAASLGNVLTDPRLNHVAELCEGVFADEARALLQDFFRAKRAEARR